jgi:N-acetylmuramoyl-L-alanine amidase
MSPLLLSQRLTIGSQVYLPGSALSQQLSAASHWDPQAQVWTLKRGRHLFRASPQIPVVLIDDEAVLLRRPPLFQEGQVLIPESVWKRWLSRWEAPPVGVAGAAVPWLKTIVVDAGHGGHDPGAIGRGGLREKAVTLDVARRLRDLLMTDGFQVVMTREGDRFVSLGQRSALANRSGGDLFISIHANASRHRSAGGFEVYYLSAATDDHARALEAAENIALPGDVKEPVDSDTRGIVWDLLYTEHRAESTDLSAGCTSASSFASAT